MKAQTKNIKKLQEKLNVCKRLLAEKRFQEATFEDIIKPSMDLLNKVHAANVANELDLPPLEDDLDFNRLLSTSENDLDSTDGTLNEAALERIKKTLQEAKLNEMTYNDIIKDYIRAGGSQDYDAWRDWLIDQSEDVAQKGAVLNKWAFDTRYNQLSSVTSAGKPVAAAPEPVVDPNYVPSDNLQSLIDICCANEEYAENALTTVTDKYDTIDLILRRVVRGKSTKRYYILAGDAGIGKTYTVSKILKEEGKADDIDKITFTGSIGRSVTSIATFLWQHRNDELLVLDDCDTFLRKDGNPDVINILKGCMEPGTGHTVGIPDTIAKKITKSLGSPDIEDMSLEDLIDQQGLEAEAEKEANAGDFAVPTKWVFNARLIIISNLHESQINDALWSRCDHYDLHLTQEEYLIRLAAIIDGMDVGQKSNICTEEEAKEAKALVLSVLQAIIEAGVHGVKIFGKFIQLTDHLEFRIVKDLVNTWLAMLEQVLEKNPGISRDEAKKSIMNKWLRISVIPRLSARVVL